MSRFLFRLIPWWLYAAFAILLAPIALELVNDYRIALSARALAEAVGPPPPAKVGSFDPVRDAGPLDEVVLNGALRADLGVIEVTSETVDSRAVLMGGEGEGPLIAILMPGATANDTLTRLVDGVDTAGRVTVQGILTSAQRDDIRFQLRTFGLQDRPLYVVEPYFDNRAAALDGQVQDALTGAVIIGGIVLLFAALAVWRWRERRAARRAERQVNVSAPIESSTPEPTQARPARSRPPRTRAPKTPWGDGIAVPSESVFVAPPPIPDDPPPLDPSVLPKTEREFESVFPGGGSGFRFKTADEIIRQSFGTLTTLTPSKPKE